ncbi:hypothetical protein LUZ60_000728 [Juncus effusus]|nr:hypothetical protein LUZ60_000728 [Juncus effusus]
MVSERLPNLRYLSYPTSKEPGKIFRSALTNFKSLKGIAVHIIIFITTEIPSLLSTHFPDLSELKLFGEPTFYCSGTEMICKSFPKLRKLEMPLHYLRIDTSAVLMFLNLLEHLEYLDISGCVWWIDKEIIEKASRLKDVYLVFPDRLT